MNVTAQHGPRIALVVMMAFAAATAYGLEWDQKTVQRSWKDQSVYLGTDLRVDVPGSGTGYQPPVTINVRLRFPSDAKLRLGEIERFKVEARVRSSERAGYRRIEVSFTPETYYHRYRRDWQYLNVYVREGEADGERAYEWVTFHVTHSGRIKTGAPATIDQAKVDFTTPAEPFKLQWRDFGFDENGGAPTTYRVAIYRSSLLTTKLVAKGDVPRVDGETQSVAIEQGGPFTAGADEWFEIGKKYWVFLLVKRTGTEWYSDGFGAAFEGSFTYKAQDTKLVVGPTGAADIVRRGTAFEELHRD